MGKDGVNMVPKSLFIVAAILVVCSFQATAENLFKTPIWIYTSSGLTTVYTGDYVSSFNCNISQNVSATVTYKLNDTIIDSNTLNRTIYETCGSRVMLMNESLGRLLTRCEEIVNDYDEVFNYYDPYVDCVSNLTSSRDKVESLKLAKEEATKCAGDFEKCEKDLEDAGQRNTETRTQLATATSGLDTCKEEKKTQNTYLWLAVILAGIGWGILGKQYWDKKNKEPKLPSSKGQLPSVYQQ